MAGGMGNIGSMSIAIELSSEAERLLRGAFGANLAEAAVESLIVQGYRTGKLSHFEVQQALGLLSWQETELWLTQHAAELSYGEAELEADARTLDRLLPERKP
jgi:hypothetical protein